MTPLTTVLAGAALLWPLALGGALVDRLDHEPSLASGVVYLAASRVCHQRADRSFHTQGQKWPVCARCAGLYLAAPFGVLIGARPGRRHRAALARVVTIAAIPLAATWIAETALGWPMPGGARFLTALPLGVAVAYALVVLAGPADRIG